MWIPASYESKIKVLHFSQLPYSCRFKKMTFAQFLDDISAKIFSKHPGEVKIKVHIFMNVFGVGDHTLCMVTVLCGWYHPFWWCFLSGGVAPPCDWAGICNKRWSQTTMGGH